MQIRYELNKTTKSSLVKTLSDFVYSSLPSRMVGKPGHAKARDYIISEITKFDPKKSGKIEVDKFSVDAEFGKTFYQNDFDQRIKPQFEESSPDYQKWSLFTQYIKTQIDQYKTNAAENIIWHKAGKDPSKKLVVLAHYDTISFDMNTFRIDEKSPTPGANYNGTGVSIALRIVEALSRIPSLNYSVDVVFVDWQGLGYLGSHQYAKKLKSEDNSVIGFLNLEMLGQDSIYFDKNKVHGNMVVYHRAEDTKFIQSLIFHGDKMLEKVKFESKAIGFDNSDNIRLWEQGFIGGTFSQNWEDDFNPKFYQTPHDTPETLNQDTFYQSYMFIGGAVLGTLLDITK